jgi:glutathione reductase (NADPH)
VQIIQGQAQIRDAHHVVINEKVISCERILIATGAKPVIPDIVGNEFIVTSNDMFSLPSLPKRIFIVGGGYIAVEFAGILHNLGVKTTLCCRSDKLLRGFDDDVRDFVAQEMIKKGIDIHFNSYIERIEKNENEFIAYSMENEAFTCDLVLYATGREPNTEGLGLETLGVEKEMNGTIKVNSHYQTNIPSLYALGDVANTINLTPVATAEAMAFVNYCYKNQSTPVDYDTIPTAVFSQPNIGTVGLTENEARKRYSEIDIYKSVFTSMKHTLSGLGEKTLMKMVVNRSNDKVLGIHMVGSDAGEIIQGMAIAIRAGATKTVFDSTLGIHPTAAEEFVSMRTPI